MRVIGVLNTKGGCGKTTLASCLAVRASSDGMTAVCDLDSQGSYSDWYKRRGSPDNPALLVGADFASDALEGLRNASPYEYVLLDGPPGAIGVTQDAVEQSDLVIIPMRASTLDLAASLDCIQLCMDSGTPMLAVCNAKGQHDGKLVEQLAKMLGKWKVPMASTIIPHRASYINAVTTGKAGPEKDKKAAEEIDALWLEILAILRKSKRRRAA